MMRRAWTARWAPALFIAATMNLAIGFPVSAEPIPGSGAVAIIVNTDGDGLNVRDTPSTAAVILTAMPEGATVELLATDIYDDAGMAWSQVGYAGLVGYSASQYLSSGAPETEPVTDGDSAAAEPADDEPEPPISALAFVSGTDGDGLNLRLGPGLDAAILTAIPEGAVVLIVDGPRSDPDGNPWYQVEAPGGAGWVHGGYLVAAERAATDEPDQSDEPDEPEIADDEIGAAIVAEALNYLGTPYLWAGTTPDGFDCSGFTYFVMNQVLAGDSPFPRAIEEQVASGEYVSQEDLQPGDLVFFENTYQPGLSHVGVYIGNGEFVNAGSEIDVVAISHLAVSYWSERYLTARRIRD